MYPINIFIADFKNVIVKTKIVKFEVLNFYKNKLE